MKKVEWLIVDIDNGTEYEVERLSSTEYTRQQALSRYFFHQDTKGGNHHLYKITSKREHIAG